MVTRPLRVNLAISLDAINMMALSRREKEELILDLYYNKGKTYHEIAKEARISLRDIKGILDRGVHGAEGEQSMSVSSKAYKLLSENKCPLEVAIALNLRANEVTQFYKECWYLKQLYDLNQIYLETKGGQEQYQSKNYGSEDYMDMLVEEADKLWNMLPKELVDKIISDYSTPSRTSLSSLSPPDEG